MCVSLVFGIYAMVYKAPAMGMADVYVDGEKLVTLDAHRGGDDWPWLAKKRGMPVIMGISNRLEARPHKVEFRILKKSSDPKGSMRFQLIGLLTVAQS